MLKVFRIAAALTVAATAVTTTAATAQTTAAVGQTTLPAREGYAAVPGGRIHYLVIGDLKSGKTPLLVLHGAYMSSDGMKPFTDRFARTRPVIAVDQRGHGRTGDLEGPITYERLADDAAAVVQAAGAKRVDVFGYSLGAGAAIQLAIRHPEVVGKLVSVSGSYRSTGFYPENMAAIARIDAKVFEGTRIKRDYERSSPTPSAFPRLVDKLNALDGAPQDWTADQIGGIVAKTMIVAGDHDVVRPEHEVEMFRLRGGAPASLTGAPFLTAAPPARLAILPATSHLGIMAQPDLVVALVLPFLDDATPAAPGGFF